MDPIAEQLIARLQSDPRDGAAYEALKAHYRHAGDFASLANLLEGWADNNTHDAPNAARAYAEAAESVLRSGGDRARALRLYRLAVQLDVHHEEASQRLQELLEEAGDDQKLAEFLDGYARALERAGGDPAHLAAIYRRLGALWQERFDRADIAAAYHERAAELAGGDPATLSPPRAEPAALAAEYEAALAHERDPERRGQLLSQLAELKAQHFGDLAGAIQALRAALAAVPGEVAIMHQLATCLLARAAASEPEAARADHRRVAELFYQIAQAVDPGAAIPYLESALTSMPDHDGALALLERLAEEQGRTDLLPRFWVGYVASAGEGPELDQRRFLLGQAYLHAGQLDDAVYCLKAAAEHGNDRAHELLQEAYARMARVAQPSEAAASERPGSLLPTSRRREQRSADDEARESAQISALRKQVHAALAARKHDQAAEHCRHILELEPSDPEAFTLLESHYRKRRDYASLRDLLLASTRVPGLAVDTRKLRLREVATLSETKLRDPEAAISAFRGVVTLDPGDREAGASLKRLLKKAQQWDELASVLEREALATTAVDEKAALIREIALIHRDKRKDPHETAEAFRQLHALKPEDTAVRDELCELLLSLESFADAVPLLRERIATCADEIDRLKLNIVLAQVLHERLSEYDEAFDACEAILKLRPNDRSTLERMERIDVASGNHERLLETLQRRAQLAGKAERPALFIRMGEIAERALHDVDKAAEYYGDALDLVPDHADALERLSRMFEGAGRYAELVELLRERTLLEKEPKNRAPLFRRIAEILADRLHDEDGAADAYRSLLDLQEDEAALRFLRAVALRTQEHEELGHILRRLAALVENPGERRDLLFEQAQLLFEHLSRPAEAAVALKRIVEDLDPRFEPAIELLVRVAGATSDTAALALALERRLALLAEPEGRVPLARRLAELCENELRDTTRAIAALQQWARDEPQNPEPQRRLRPLLESEGRNRELLDTLDALSEWELELDARDEATIAGARLCHEKLGDGEGGFGRLLALVEQRNEAAERALRELASSAGLQRQLAALYVKLAQETADPAVQAGYWKSAAEVYERELHDPVQAFEASLRMLATDLGNRQFLSEVDRLGRAISAFKRLAQVYERLIKQAEDEADKVALLTRHADLLENDQPSEALDRVLRACALAPQDERLLERAEQLAQRTDRSEELLIVYDRKRAKSSDDEEKLRLLLRAARLCDGALRDRERANLYLKTALAVAGESAAMGAEVEAVARELDAEHPDFDGGSALRDLVRAHREVAERAEPGVATRLWLRAAELLAGELADERSAFDVLRQGLGMMPKSEAVYAALLELATRLKRLDAVDAHLARLVDEAIDQNTAVILLERRGALLEGPLQRSEDAAAVYGKLLQLRPDEAQAAEKLRASLRRAGRYQDLLLALNKQLQRTRDPARRLALLKEIAQSWERDLKNRWEAIDAWKAVMREAPDDGEASVAVQRLERAARGGASEEPEPVSSAPEAQPSKDSAEQAAAEADAAEAASEQAPEEREKDPPQAEPEAREPASQPAANAAEPEPEPEPQAEPEPEPEEDGLDDLAALDAGLSAAASRIEEVDVLEDLDGAGLESELQQAGGAAKPAPRVAPPIPGKRTSSVPPPIPAAKAPAARAASAPPPLPGRSVSPPPRPPGTAPRSSSPPPLPSRKPTS